MKHYVETELPNQSPNVQKVINSALSMLENYHAGLKEAWDISELLPSQAQRETHQRFLNRQMTEAHKEVQKNSIINLFTSKSVILYGRKSINYVNGPNNQVNRMEIPLQRFGSSIEFPRLEYMDPHGLDYMLRVFQIEECER